MKITEYEAAWNVTNAIQGMFIVSAIRCVSRGLLGNHRHGRHRLHLLPHRQDPG